MLANHCTPPRILRNHLARTMCSTLAGKRVLAATGQENMPCDELPPEVKLQKIETEQLRVCLLNENAVVPRRGSSGAAGFDLAR